MDVVTGVELECSYGAGDGRTRSGVASMPKERSGGPRLDRSCDWEKYGYDTPSECLSASPVVSAVPYRFLSCPAALSSFSDDPRRPYSVLRRFPVVPATLSSP